MDRTFKDSLLRSLCFSCGLGSALSNATSQIVPIDVSVFDASGSPASGSHSVQIKAYAAATGGSALWTSDAYSGLTATAGRLRVPLDTSYGSPSLQQVVSDTTTSSALWFEVIYDGKTVNSRFRSHGALFAVNAVSAGTADAIRSIPVSTATPNTGDLMRYNGSQWVATSAVTALSTQFYQRSGRSECTSNNGGNTGNGGTTYVDYSAIPGFCIENTSRSGLSQSSAVSTCSGLGGGWGLCRSDEVSAACSAGYRSSSTNALAQSIAGNSHWTADVLNGLSGLVAGGSGCTTTGSSLLSLTVAYRCCLR